MPDMNEAAEPEFKKFGRDRYSPGAYSLDLTSVLEIPVKANGELSTFGEVYVKLKGAKAVEEFQFRHYKYVTEHGDVSLECDWPVASILQKLVKLTQRGIDPHDVTWFYFGHDWSRDADEAYSFFAVYQGKIIDEDCHFNAEEPLMLIQKRDDDPIWHSQPHFDEAWKRYCYRKFYTETVTGQLMVLRPDDPILFYFTRSQPQGYDPLRQAGYVTLVKTYHLLWAAIPLLIAIAFPSVRLYMAVVASLLIVDVLWRAWTTRKFFE